MPDLESRIALWRARMAARLPAQAVRELEEHLRDHLDSRGRVGVDPMDAFEEAVKRIGEPPVIAREFGRMAAPWFPVVWPVRVVVAVLVLAVSSMLFLFLAEAGLPRRSGVEVTPLLAVHVATVGTGYLAVFAIGALGVCGFLMGARRELQERERRDLCAWLRRLAFVSCALVLLGTVLGMVWASQNWGRAWGWDSKEIGALMILASVATVALVQKLPAIGDRAQWWVALLAAMTVSVGWFGANVFPSAFPLVTLGALLVGGQIAVAWFGGRGLSKGFKPGKL